jgi:hypothetical protein
VVKIKCNFRYIIVTEGDELRVYNTQTKIEEVKKFDHSFNVKGNVLQYLCNCKNYIKETDPAKQTCGHRPDDHDK